MRDDVMKLACDPSAFGRDGQGRPLLLFALQVGRPGG
jgi:hypothetical protein